MKEYVKLTVSGDSMLATIFIHPPVEGENVTIEDIKEVIDDHHITNGIDYELLNQLEEKFEFKKVYEIARGNQPILGKDGKVIYHFNTNKHIKPTLNDDGTVDFHNLDLISNINKGDVLVTLEPEIEGRPGLDIYGNEVPPPPVKKYLLPKSGPNIHKTEDGLQLISDIEGHVDINYDKVVVSEVLTISGNVDNATGDISYNGSILVTGNVLSGFSVKANKNIEVIGLVEGATLLASGNIVIRGGIQGMDKARIICAGTLVTKYIANAFVKANGSINTNTILHSDVSCNDTITLAGKGLISGGKVRANREISAKTIGTNLGTKTFIEVGVDPDIVEKFQEFKEKKVTQEEELRKIEQIIKVLEDRKSKGAITPDRQVTLDKSYKTRIKLINELKTCDSVLTNLQPMIENVRDGKIKALMTIYPGTVATIGSQSMVVRNNIDRCSLVYDAGAVRIGAY